MKRGAFTYEWLSRRECVALVAVLLALAVGFGIDHLL